tara:strand:+ start:505 stop:903 length:399 start_codon:yes stop_codon:yes gene_type:complete
MNEEFKLEIVNPEKSFLSKEDVTEVLVPAYEGDMGILKDHISIISFLKPGILKVFSKSGEDKYYIEDGIIEFKDNTLSILTSSIFSLDNIDRNYVSQSLSETEQLLNKEDLDDQSRFLISQKIDVLKSISSN